MAVKYGLTLDNILLIAEKAKTKENGVYTLRGVIYRVNNLRVTHYAVGGAISENYGNFLVDVGKYTYASEAVKMLKGIKK